MDSDSNSSNSSDEYDELLLFHMQTTKIKIDAMKTIISTQQQNDVPGKKKGRYVPRDREGANDRLISDYFSAQPLYTDEMFRRRFRMRRHLFERIVNTLKQNNSFFQPRPDATGREGASALQKCTAAMRMLAYGTSADQIDKYLKLGESTANECLKHFVEGVIAQFSTEYLRKANPDDIQRLLTIGERRGFPGMICSIDYMHWEWKNCPVAWKGMYQGRSRTATIILEAVASSDLWIWHAFFGTPGSCNDINVLQRSPVFDDVLHGHAPQVTFNVNGNTYNTGYYLTDGIYPKWASFVSAISLPQTPKHKKFSELQESVRKDVERAFGVLQARFAIIRQPGLAWSKDILWKIMMAYIIMHNMIVEDERDKYLHYDDPTEFLQDHLENVAGSSSRNAFESFTVHSGRLQSLNLRDYMDNRSSLHDRQTHMSLKNDLVEHVCNHVRRSSST